MQKDVRLSQLAENILKNSVKLKKGERVYIEFFGRSTLDLMEEFIRVASELGAIPYYFFNDEALMKQFIVNATDEQMKSFGLIHKELMSASDAYVAVRGKDDAFLMADVDKEHMERYLTYYYNPVHRDIRVPKTRWCIMRYPNNSMAAMSRMSLKSFEDFYFNACLLDYTKMSQAMDSLVALMNKTDRVKIVAPNTNLEFSIKNIQSIKCDGAVNIPDGEVYTAPVNNSINGVIQFNTDTIYNGTFFSNIRLEFENGKIVKGTSLVNDDKLQDILNMDSGSRHMGEFAIGVNPHVTKPILDILFDEKISGSIHMAIGNSYDDADNGNKSAIHWDLVLIQTPENGGGEIYFDDVLIRKDGIFVIDELKCLNPDELM